MCDLSERGNMNMNDDERVSEGMWGAYTYVGLVGDLV